MVTAVRSVDTVGRTQRDNRSDRAAFLTDARMRGTVHESLTGELEDRLFERSDQVELTQDCAEQGRISGLPVLGCRLEIDPWNVWGEWRCRGHAFTVPARWIHCNQLLSIGTLIVRR